jgi:tRNA pseudouridine55 synthase
VSVFVVDKPVGPSSYDIVRQVQRALHRLYGFERPRDLKVGHGGTLDPMASGVLPVCVGEGTKIAGFLLDGDKEYEAEVRFGQETDTLDATGKLVAEAPSLAVASLGPTEVEAALVGFRGIIEQVPPMHSALKHEGRPLYSYARAGQEIARAPRRLTIHALSLEAWRAPATARLRVRCSKGTYIRVLAADIGRTLGVGGHLVGLRRTVSGPFALSQALTPAAIAAAAAGGHLPAHVSLSQALAHLPALSPEPASATAIWQGKKVPLSDLGLPTDAIGQFRVLRPDGSLFAIAEVEAGCLRSLRGFHPEAPSPQNLSASPHQGGGGLASVVSFGPSSEMGPEPQLLGALGLTSTHLL